MQTHPPDPNTRASQDDPRVNGRTLRRAGVVLSAAGVLAMGLPQIATFGVERLTAWIMALWGAIGLWLSWSLCPAHARRPGLAAFGLIFGAGLLFAVVPVAGIATLSVLMMLSFLCEGLLSILFALRCSSYLRNWGWLVFSGACSLAAGLVILFFWPWAESWTLSLLVGLNFLSTGMSLILAARRSRS